MASDDLLKQGQRIWEMLDEMAATNPDAYKKFIDKQMNDGARILKPPEPVFSLHCKTAENVLGSPDLYINVCSWQQVPKPKSDQDPIPVKGGTLRKFTPPSTSRSVQIFDLAFNPSVTEECCKSPQLEHMLTELCMDYIEKQARIDILRKTCCKQKEPCFGPKRDLHFSLNEQYKHLLVTDDSKPEFRLPGGLGGSHNNSSDMPPDLMMLKLGDEATSTPSGGRLIEEIGDRQEVVPVYEVKREDDGEGGRCVVVRVELPKVSTVSDVDLEINENVLELQVPDLYAVNITFDEAVDEDSVKATFDKTTRVLLVKLPVL
jgi:HSP20 family molecular chaperone IbpA